MDRLLSVIHISLSDFELRVLSLYLGGYKRQEAERKLGISARAFDNAMARVRKKLRQKNNDSQRMTFARIPFLYIYIYMYMPFHS